MRCFVAVELPDSLRTEILAFQSELHMLMPRLRLIPAENLHLTLVFLGNLEANRVSQVQSLTAQIEISRFEIAPAGLSAFPTLSRPHVIWIGLQGQVQQLTALFQQLASKFSTLGLTLEDRDYIPHITIAKLDRVKRIEPIPPVPPWSFSPFPVERIHLFESIPPRPYRKLASSCSTPSP